MKSILYKCSKGCVDDLKFESTRLNLKLKFQSSFFDRNFPLLRFLLDPVEILFSSISFERNIFEYHIGIFPGDLSFSFRCNNTRRGAGDPVGRSHAEAPLLGEKRSDEQTSDTVDFLSLALIVPADTQPAFFLRRSLSLSLSFSLPLSAVRDILRDTNTSENRRVATCSEGKRKRATNLVFAF